MKTSLVKWYKQDLIKSYILYIYIYIYYNDFIITFSRNIYILDK